jgi:hypothetical protein
MLKAQLLRLGIMPVGLDKTSTEDCLREKLGHGQVEDDVQATNIKPRDVENGMIAAFVDQTGSPDTALHSPQKRSVSSEHPNSEQSHKKRRLGDQEVDKIHVESTLTNARTSSRDVMPPPPIPPLHRSDQPTVVSLHNVRASSGLSTDVKPFRSECHTIATDERRSQPPQPRSSLASNADAVSSPAVFSGDTTLYPGHSNSIRASPSDSGYFSGRLVRKSVPDVMQCVPSPNPRVVIAPR